VDVSRSRGPSGSGKRNWLRCAARVSALALLLLAAAVTTRYWPRAALATRIATSTAVYDHQDRLLRLTLASDGQYRLWVPLQDVPADTQLLLLLHEDQYFYRHPGINPFALVRAAFRTATGRSTEGASTITMQLARLLYGLKTRSIGGKLQQIARALQLELCYSKRALLEAHLNLLPYGGNVQGIGTASRVYFNKNVARFE
jgi:penicillin-binding protein 1C